ncbi:hypothetical protein ACGFY7_23510 [Streptomyces prunicolor]|uniref:hypothetical protein n=1 Tax=Streptomyces prunicolor TaxID=67348 RepID=UPI00371C2733
MSDLEEQAAVEEEPEPRGMSERTAKAIVVVIACGAMWGMVAAFPWVAYVVVGVLGTLGHQKARGWTVRRRESSTETPEEVPPPDVGDALRRLVGDDNGVLLTRLRDDLKLPNTKVVKQLLDEAGVTWKAVRTRRGNGPGVHKGDIPAAPSPVADSHGDGCCCRSGGNGNSDNSGGEGPGERFRVDRTDTGVTIHDLRNRVGTGQGTEAAELLARFLGEVGPLIGEPPAQPHDPHPRRDPQRGS